MCFHAVSAEDPEAELLWATDLVNAVVGDTQDLRLGVHVCRGNWTQKEEVLLTGSYQPLLSYLASMHVSQWVLEFATPMAGDLGVFKERPNIREIGLGVVNPRSTSIETVDVITSRVEEALHHFEASQVFFNPDCGFGTFAERSIATPESATQKLRVMVEAARALRRKYGSSSA